MNTLIASPRNRQQYVMPYMIQGKTILIAPKGATLFIRENLETLYLDLSETKAKDFKHSLLLDDAQVLLVNPEKLHATLKELKEWGPDTVSLFYGEKVPAYNTHSFKAMKDLVSGETCFCAGMNTLPSIGRLFNLAVLLNHATHRDFYNLQDKYGTPKTYGSHRRVEFPDEAGQRYWEDALSHSKAFKFVDLTEQEHS